MTAGAPWSVKGIDPKAREVAKDLARRSGMTLGEWLNRMILEDDPDDAVSKALFGDRAPPRQQRPAIEIPPRAAGPAAPQPYYDPPARSAAPHSREDIARVALALDRLTDHIEASETRTGLAISGVEQSVRAALSRIDAGERQTASALHRVEGLVDEVRAEQARAAERLRKVEQEAAGPRSAEALKALEAALGKVAARLDHKDDRTQDLLTAVEGRIQRLEGGETTSSAVVEDSFGKLAERLAQAESRTAEAVEGLRESFVALEGRLRTVESGEPIDKRLESLAASLGQRLDEARVEIAAQLTASAEDRFDRMERKLGEMAGAVQAAEQRSAQAIETMGMELAGVARSLNQRVEAAEAGSAKAIDMVGAEVARIGETVEARLARSDNVQAEALGKLSTEITRISERLTERISNAERRSAQAIDDVGEQVARITERIGQRTEKASDDLADRIRASEERTARLLEEAREKIDQRLAEAQARLAEQVKAAAPPPPPEPALPPAESFDEPVATAPEPVRPAPTPPKRFAVKPMFSAAFPPLAAPAPPRPTQPEFDETDFEAAAGFAPAAMPADDGLADPTISEPAPAAKVAAPAELDPLAEVLKAIGGATPAEAPRAEADIDAELLKPPALEPAPAFDADPAAGAAPDFAPELDDPFEAAPAASAAADDLELEAAEPLPAPTARAFGVETDPEPTDELFDEPAAPPPAAERPLTARELIEQARAAARQAAHDPKGARKAAARKEEGGGLFSGFSVARPKKAARTLPTALMVVGGVAAASLSIGGLVVMSEDIDGQAQVAQGEAGPADGLTATPRAAVAIAPKKLAPQAAAAQADPNVELLYGQAVQEIEGGGAEGLDKLQKAANLGHAPAQFYLARLYEAGRGGLKQDLAEARKWTERAAEGGERKAMHNLALYYFEGTGGPKNTTTASEWFQRAAEMGLTDSQYNLGRLYEEGVGVPQNAAEAYRWYLIASRSGDGESRASAQRVRGTLTAEARVVAEKSAAAFRAAAPANLAVGADKAQVATAQRALSRLGYYQLQGPADGVPSPALRMAIAAYQRDQELPATGELDSLTVSRLAVFTR